MLRCFFLIFVTLKDISDCFICISFIISKCEHIFIESPAFEPHLLQIHSFIHIPFHALLVFSLSYFWLARVLYIVYISTCFRHNKYFITAYHSSVNLMKQIFLNSDVVKCIIFKLGLCFLSLVKEESFTPSSQRESLPLSSN